ncbi:hypothetical protein OIU79_010017 [Salix purpurea]|uniref:Uncharacterized protein n=1 Tax=Salix purpurea TaxID=77065 RepID=A0A9Q0QEL9_SALPP|nr:hypothetical protein OIU79_010017 [Salix purpurea]
MAEMQLLIDVSEELQNKLGTSMQDIRWNKRSIYKLPASVTVLNRTAYRPQIVSFGPYHYYDDQLKRMEEHKHRALYYFLRRSGKSLELFLQSLNEVVQDLRDSYDQLDKSWEDDTNKFLQLMILDGCFMLEIMYLATAQSSETYAADDPVFSSHGKVYMVPFIRRDMLIVENQLPMLVLYKLAAIESDGRKNEESVSRLILTFCCPDQASVSVPGKCLHVLDLYRKSLIQEDPNRKRHQTRVRGGLHKDVNDTVRSAAEINEAGIRFKKSKTKSLKDISLHHGVLHLPAVVVDDVTEAVLLNLMAFERFHPGAGNEVTSYVFFMDSIIDSERDVALLHSKGIIQNAIGSDKAVAKLFNSLSKNIALDPDSSLDLMQKQVNAYCRKPWNAWRANLIQTYFRNPWAILSLVAALMSLGSDDLTTTLCNSIQALGRGFDVTSDIRLLYCKGATGSRLVHIDEEHARDLDISHELVLPSVSFDIDCSPGRRSIERIPVCSFHEPPIEDLQYFLDFQIANGWAPEQNNLQRKEPVCQSLQFSLMGPKLYISPDQLQVTVGPSCISSKSSSTPLGCICGHWSPPSGKVLRSKTAAGLSLSSGRTSPIELWQFNT